VVNLLLLFAGLALASSADQHGVDTLTLAAIALPNAYSFTPYSASFTARNGVPPYRFEVIGAYPPGLLPSTNGVISGTPTFPGIYSMRVRVVDGSGNTFTGDVTLRVIGGLTLTIQAPNFPDATLGSPYSYDFRAIGVAGTPAFQVSSGSLPPGLTLSPPGRLSGTPVAVGTYSFVVRATVQNLDATASFTMRVTATNTNPPRLLDLPQTVFVIGQPRQFIIPTSGGREPLRFQVTGGLFQAGCSFGGNSLRCIGKVPGTHPLTIRVTDASGGSHERTYMLQTEAAREMPAALSGRRYVYRDPAIGGARVQLTVDARLPLGLIWDRDGTISGTPWAAGRFNFALRLDRTDGTSETRSYTLTVQPAVGELTVDSIDIPTQMFNATISQPLTTVPAADSVRVATGELPPGLRIEGTTITGVCGAGCLSTTELALDLRSGAFSALRFFQFPIRRDPGLDALIPLIHGVANAAGYQLMAVSPGEILTIFGERLDGISARLGGLPAPLVYATPRQAAIIAPFALEPGTEVLLELHRPVPRGASESYIGGSIAADPLRVPVVMAKPAFFSANGTGRGAAAALNQDGSVNSPLNPAAPGSVVVLYGTGFGRLEAPVADGQPGTQALRANIFLNGQLSVTIGSEEATVLYSGAAPGLVNGAIQTNIQLPRLLPAGSHAIRVRVGERVSPEVSVFVR
jgi:uncharacterized protein (TIGR03437 family)